VFLTNGLFIDFQKHRISKVTYADDRIGETIRVKAPEHGGHGGTQDSFQLKPGEYIAAVQGRHNNYIVQLCFVTNLGRKSRIYGGGVGAPFRCEAPRKWDGNPMRLSYLAGKSGKWLNGLLFVWAPL